MMPAARFLRRFAWTIVVLTVVPAGLRAEESGWYAGIGLGASYADLPESFWTDGSITSPDTKNLGPGFEIFGGYRLHRHVALEMTYLRLGNAEFTGDSSGAISIWNAGPVEGRVEIDGILLQGVGLWPVADSTLAFYLKGGLFMWDTVATFDSTINEINRFSDDGVDLIGGVGAEARLWGDWHLRGEIEYTTVTVANREIVPVGFAAIGLMYPLR